MDEKTWKSSTVTERLNKLKIELNVSEYDYYGIGRCISSALLACKAYDEYFKKWGD